MAVGSPVANDPERAAPWEQGYIAGYAEPETDHLPPLEPELLEVFGLGEQTGRDDRRNEPASQDPLPSSASSDFSRFEAAPDGTLIPIPDEAPEGNRIRDDAQIRVNPRNAAAWYYVVIYNGSTESKELLADATELLAELQVETVIVGFEHLIAHAVVAGLQGVVKFGGLIVGVAISLLNPSPILRETRFRGHLEDGTPIGYVVLTPMK